MNFSAQDFIAKRMAQERKQREQHTIAAANLALAARREQTTEERDALIHADQARRLRAHEASSRRELFAVRYNMVAAWWMQYFRHLRWRQSLRVVFQTPALYSIPHMEQGYNIPQEQFCAAFIYASEPGTHGPMPPEEMRRWLDIAWRTFDPTASGTMDYREFLVVWLIMRLEPGATPHQILDQMWRAYDGDARSGLPKQDLVQMLASLAVNHTEVSELLAACNWAALAPPPKLKFTDDLHGGRADPDWLEESDDDETPLVVGGVAKLGVFARSAVDEAAVSRAKQRSKLREEERKQAERVDPITGETRPGDASWVSSRTFRRFLGASPGLMDVVAKLVRARLPPILAAARLRFALQSQVARIEEQLERIDWELGMRDALIHWRKLCLRRYFDVWMSDIKEEVLLRGKHESLRKRRAIRGWFKATHRARVAKKQQAVAEAHLIKARGAMAMRAWWKWLMLERQVVRLQQQRAVRFHQWSTRESVFIAWRDVARGTRADTHAATSVQRRCFAAWQRFTEDEKAAAARAAANAAAAASMAAATKVEVEDVLAMDNPTLDIDQYTDAELAKLAEQEQLRAEIENQKMVAEIEWAQFEDEARQIAEENDLEMYHAETTVKQQREAKLKLQAAARARAKAARRALAQAEFDAKWEKKRVAAVDFARKGAQELLLTREGKNMIKERAKEIQLAEHGMSDVFQQFSAWVAKFDEMTGLMVLRHEETGEEIPQDNISDKNAKRVAAAHILGSKIEAAEQRTAARREEDLPSLERNLAARTITQFMRACASRQALLNMFRSVIELLVDPDTGDEYYYDERTGDRTDEPPTIFGRIPVHPPRQAWRRDYADGSQYYCMRRLPWQQRALPPEGYRMCQACGVDFADRRCHASGCSGYHYCYACWVAYHPADDPGYYAEHKASVQRVEVDRAWCPVIPTKAATIQTWSEALHFECFSEPGFQEQCSKLGIDPAEVEVTNF